MPTLALAAMTILAFAGPPHGPDLQIEDITAVGHWGGTDGRQAYSFGVSVCNVGDTVVDFFANTSQHPVVAQNLYRLRDGRFEHVGMSWAKHEFCALQVDCAGCDPGPGCAGLGAGCSSPSSASIMGSAFAQGPRTEIDPFTGAFPYPQTMPSGDPDVLLGRVQVADADIDPGQNPGAAYFAELIYVAPDDATAGNGLNNASWRPAEVVGTFGLTLTETTHSAQPALLAWRQVDPSVRLATVDVPGDGRFLVGTRVAEIGADLWSYEYAVFNLNSARAARSIAIAGAPATAFTDPGFHDVDYHSGETVDGTDWPHETDAGTIAWATSTIDQDPDANALRWGTLYNVRFTASVAPSPTAMTLGLFAPGDGDSVTVLVPGPRGCPGDLDASGAVDVDDLLTVLASFGDCNDCLADIDGDGAVDVDDLLAILAGWGDC